MGWRPIETAPRNTWVDLKFGEGPEAEADEDGPYLGILYDDADFWWDRAGAEYGDAPTHWKPSMG